MIGKMPEDFSLKVADMLSFGKVASWNKFDVSSYACASMCGEEVPLPHLSTFSDLTAMPCVASLSLQIFWVHLPSLVKIFCGYSFLVGCPILVCILLPFFHFIILQQEVYEVAHNSYYASFA